MTSKSNKGECVKVVVRVRPLNSVERERGDEVIVAVDEKRGTVACKKVGGDAAENKDFTFDYVFGSQSTQKDVFEKTARPIVDSCLGGYNGTIFAYGQTGTGKTFTMEGVMDDENLRGIMPNSFYYIMSAVAAAPTNMQYLVRVSFIEIYLDDVFDLLSTKGRIKMEVKENKEKGVFVKDVSAYVVKSVPDMLKVLKVGQKNRKVGATKMNEGSSRSHSIFTITIETSETDAQGENHYKVGKLNMVDLAGSERQKKTEATGDRLDEAKAINLSLSALGNVIKALINPNAKHIPFRDSKLTRLLQDSLGGNTKTMMVANLGPSVCNFDETMSTLRYADRAKQIKNIPRINEDPKDAMLREYQEEIAKLKAQLEARKNGQSGIPRMVAQTQPDGTVIEVPVYDGQPEVEENIIEKEVVQHTGVTEDDLIAARKKVEQEHAEFQSLSEAERKKLVDAQAEASRKAAQMEEQLKRKQQQLEKEKAEWEAFQKKIAEKEALLLHGSGKLDEAQKQKKELERVEEELRLRRQQEAKLKQDLAEAEDAELYMNEHYANSQEELAKKTKHLKALWARYQEKKADLEALTEEFSLERNDLVDTIRALDRQIKLKNMMMDAFIPAPYVELIETRAHWDSINDEWAIPGLEFAGNNIERGGGYRRRAAMNTYNPAMLGHGRSFDPTNQSGQAGNKEKSQPNAEDAHPHEVYKSYGGAAPSKKSRGSTDENSGDTANHDGERKRSGSVSKKKKKRESVQ